MPVQTISTHRMYYVEHNVMDTLHGTVGDNYVIDSAGELLGGFSL